MTDDEFEADPGAVTLEDATIWLREHVDDGAECPCCTQFAKVYRRKIHSTMARELIHFYRRARFEWFDLPLLAGEVSGRRRAYTGDSAKLRYWGLMVESGERRDDGGPAGWWRVTEHGEDFVRLRVALPKYARIYDGRCLNLTGEPVTILDALGSRFNYDELMAGL